MEKKNDKDNNNNNDNHNYWEKNILTTITKLYDCNMDTLINNDTKSKYIYLHKLFEQKLWENSWHKEYKQKYNKLKNKHDTMLNKKAEYIKKLTDLDVDYKEIMENDDTWKQYLDHINDIKYKLYNKKKSKKRRIEKKKDEKKKDNNNNDEAKTEKKIIEIE